jgi:hypothetical protein
MNLLVYIKMLKLFILAILVSYSLPTPFSSLLQKFSFDIDLSYNNGDNRIDLTSISNIMDDGNKLVFNINYESHGKISLSDDFEANVYQTHNFSSISVLWNLKTAMTTASSLPRMQRSPLVNVKNSFI